MIAILTPSLPGKIRSGSNVLILGVDEPRVLCLTENGYLSYYDMSDVVSDVRFDPENKTWSDIGIPSAETTPDE